MSDGITDHEYHNPGNYYIMKGTWVRAPSVEHRDLGVISNIREHDTDGPRKGTINILWFPDTSEHLSAMALRHKLRTGALVVDNSQHPYDKVSWKTGPQEVSPRAD